mmetsp:Transcript_28940/g.94228  ORF Transcript_28940/g.94228 Transcript_28940/m.94228 type:complete len:116 (+) Transcript_28940:257-604(+)
MGLQSGGALSYWARCDARCFAFQSTLKSTVCAVVRLIRVCACEVVAGWLMLVLVRDAQQCTGVRAVMGCASVKQALGPLPRPLGRVWGPSGRCAGVAEARVRKRAWLGDVGRQPA